MGNGNLKKSINVDNFNLGLEIKNLRIFKKISLQDLATKSSIHLRRLILIEANRKVAELKEFFAICKVLDVDVNDLLILAHMKNFNEVNAPCWEGVDVEARLAETTRKLYGSVERTTCPVEIPEVSALELVEV